MKHTNFTKSLTGKLKAVIQKLSSEIIMYPPINHDIPYNLQAPLTKFNFDLIRETLTKDYGKSIWLDRAICLLDIVYPAFIALNKGDNRFVTVGMFIDFLQPDSLVTFAFSDEGKSCGCAQPIANLREHLFNVPGLNNGEIPHAESASLARQQLGFLIRQIEDTILCLSISSLFVNKGGKLFGYKHYRIQINY